MGQEEIKNIKKYGKAFSIEILPLGGYRLTFMDDLGDYVSQDFKTIEGVLQDIKVNILIIELYIIKK